MYLRIHMYVYMSLYMYINLHLYISIHICICTYTNVHLCDIYLFIRTCTLIYACNLIPLCVPVGEGTSGKDG
jgi:hypothetical protein